MTGSEYLVHQEKSKKNMVDEDRMIQMGEKMSMHVLSNIRWFNNQKSLIMFTYINHGHK